MTEKEEYRKAIEYASKKFKEFYNDYKIELNIYFKNEEMKFIWDNSKINGQDRLRKCLDFVDELNENLKEAVK